MRLDKFRVCKYCNTHLIHYISKIIRHSYEYHNWRKKVFEKDNYTCQKCGSHGGILNAHHIVYLSDIIRDNKIEFYNNKIRCDLLWNLTNEITLCKKCHTEVHTGVRNGNTKKK